jgi:hypothetical protein
MAMITTRMPLSLLKRQEGVYLCLLSLQEELEDADQWTPKERVWQSCGFRREFFQAEIVPTINKHSGRCVSCEGWKHSEIQGEGECIVKAKERSPFDYINFTVSIEVWTQAQEGKTLPLDICNEVQEDFVLVHKKCLLKQGGQAIKQVSKP